MKLYRTSLIAIAVTLLLAGCGNHQAAQHNSSSVSSSSFNSISSQSSQSSSNSGVSSNSNSSSNNVSNTNISDDKNKLVGVMVALLVSPDFLKEYINQNTMFYNASASDKFKINKGWSYISAHGDPTSYIYYKFNSPDDIAIRTLDAKKDVASAKFKTIHVTLNRLTNDYYVNKAQKDEVNKYVSELKPEQASDK